MSAGLSAAACEPQLVAYGALVSVATVVKAPAPLPLTWKATEPTPATASAAVAERVIVPPTIEPAAGPVNAPPGGVLSTVFGESGTTVEFPAVSVTTS